MRSQSALLLPLKSLWLTLHYLPVVLVPCCQLKLLPHTNIFFTLCKELFFYRKLNNWCVREHHSSICSHHVNAQDGRYWEPDSPDVVFILWKMMLEAAIQKRHGAWWPMMSSWWSVGHTTSLNILYQALDILICIVTQSNCSAACFANAWIPTRQTNTSVFKHFRICLRLCVNKCNSLAIQMHI